MGRLRILTVVGARPQIIKAAAIGRAVSGAFADRIEEVLLHTGQHYDGNMSQVFFDELGIPAPHIHLGVGQGTPATRTARMIEGVGEAIAEQRPDLVLLYGDTDSTLAGAVAASKLHVPIAHVEAGLRSFNKAMPEEINRIVCDHCSMWLFAPTATAVANLEREGFGTDRAKTPTTDRPAVVLSGDVMYDNSLHFARLAEGRSTIMASLGLEPGGFALATLHRAGNTDDPMRLNSLVRGLLAVQADHRLPVVLPLHPRTRARLDALLEPQLREQLFSAPGFHIVPPAGYLDMIALERNARIVLTDSGGVQKEAYFFGRPCVILRAETEWTELVEHGQARLVDADPERLQAAVQHFLHVALPATVPLFGDGRAAERICAELLA